MSGVRRDQSQTRAEFEPFMRGKNGITRYHPMLFWTQKMIYDYIRLFDLPKHPLHDKGYVSIGCVPCTVSWAQLTSERGGRWEGLRSEERRVGKECRSRGWAEHGKKRACSGEWYGGQTGTRA